MAWWDDILAILGATDALPDAGALTSLAQDATVAKDATVAMEKTVEEGFWSAAKDETLEVRANEKYGYANVEKR